MLPVNYGNFLKVDEIGKVRYEFNKPVISLVTSVIFCFFLAFFVVSMLHLFYVYYDTPEGTYNQSEFARAQKLNSDLSKTVALLKSVRPKNIDAVQAVDILSRAKPDGIYIEDIDITADQYVVNGQVNEIELANDYVKNIDFGPRKIVSLSQVSMANNAIKFKISVKDRPVGKAAQQNQQAQAAK